MCSAIAVCSRVDEAKEIRDKARALEVYAKPSAEQGGERKAAEIRLRAGQLLRDDHLRGGQFPASPKIARCSGFAIGQSASKKSGSSFLSM
jgi:hypothetical protein